MIGIQDEILKIHALGLLDKLLADKTTKTNILWATDAYAPLGYGRKQEIKPHMITGANAGIIKTRARKTLEHQSVRTRQHAEVFTPLWVCQKMCQQADRMGNATHWQQVVDARVLEITCGEAPFLVSRYDVATGELIQIPHRIGMLDRKLQAVNAHAKDEQEWITWATRAFQATYGYELQGDNLLIARVNLLMTFEEYLQAKWQRKPTQKEYQQIAGIISWNMWQMDGLTGTLPFCKAEEHFPQITLFDWVEPAEQTETTSPPCRIFNWRLGKSVEYSRIGQGGKTMKFDFIIGNPPYQDETVGEQKNYAPPIYHLFMEEAYKVADKVELIHPARFLFNAGGTPKEWNQKMLNDPHLKVLHYEVDSAKIFPTTDIKGGIAITYRDATKQFGEIRIFTAFPELQSILQKVSSLNPAGQTLDTIITTQLRFDLDKLFSDFPQYRSIIGSNGKDSRFRNNIFEKIPLFTEKRVNKDDIKVIGIVGNKRQWRYIPKEYVDKTHEALWKYKVLVPASNGSGALGEVLSTPLIGTPLIGYTQSFIGIGKFEKEDEARAALKYVKTKFARCMLGVLKITQHNHAETWKYVPLQDFTPDSDIDWSRSVAGVDAQLYHKYGLSKQEIDFIQSHVKEMV